MLIESVVNALCAAATVGLLALVVSLALEAIFPVVNILQLEPVRSRQQSRR